MSDSLFVTLYLLNGWRNEFVEIKEHKSDEEPETIEYEGKTFRYFAIPIYQTVQFYGGKLRINHDKGERVYFEVEQ